MMDLWHNPPIKEFEIFTDPDRMKVIFQLQLPGFSRGKPKITHFSILYARYKSYMKEGSRGKSFLSVAYEMGLTNLSTHQQEVQILYAKAYLGDRSLMEFQKTGTPLNSKSLIRETMIHFPNLGMIVWVFPHDPAMPHLQEVADPEKVKTYIPYDLLPSGAGETKNLMQVKMKVIHYRPEVRCTTRFDLLWGNSDEPRTMALFGKTFVDDRGRDIYHRMEGLWRKSLEDPDGFMVAQPLEYNETIRTIWQIGVQGDPLVRIINQDNYKRLLKSIAKGLASIHNCDLFSPGRVSITDDLQEIEKKTAKLVQAFPPLRESLEPMVRDLGERMPRLMPIHDRLTYGDFHIQQLLVQKGKIVFLDFDEFATGDPIKDIANFMVDLYFHKFDPSFVRLMNTWLFHSYRSLVPWQVPVDRLNWYIQAQFITKAYRFYVRQETNLEDIHRALTLAMEGVPLEGD